MVVPHQGFLRVLSMFLFFIRVKGWIFSERRTESGRIVAELVGGLG